MRYLQENTRFLKIHFRAIISIYLNFEDLFKNIALHLIVG